MIINLRNPRDISYRLNEVDNIDKIEYIVSFPSGFNLRFPVHLDRMTGELIINLPILEDTIQFEFDGIGYVQISRSDGMIQEVFKEVIRFVNSESIEVFNNSNPDLTQEVTDLNRSILKTNEVLVSHSNTLQFIMSNIDRSKK